MSFSSTSDSRWFRHLTDVSVVFLITVIVLRGLFVEGYLISTGSMAPHLLGLHKKVVCPDCGYRFEFGIRFDASAEGRVDTTSASARYCTCPNCGQTGIDVAHVPMCHGDQLLVYKGVFQSRHPRRFEPVVFRNPANPGEAYVKRAVGLPNEQIRIADGDVFIAGKVARKDFRTQKEMRIEVFDSRFRPDSAEWMPPYEIRGSSEPDPRSGHVRLGHGPISISEDRLRQNDVHWLYLRNWRRSGGTHFTEVPVPAGSETFWQTVLAELQQGPVAWVARLQYDRDRNVLRLQGVMPDSLLEELLRHADDAELAESLRRLAALSHVCPFTDRYGYNSPVAVAETAIHDLMLRVRIVPEARPRRIVVSVPVRNREFQIELNFHDQAARLIQPGVSSPIHTARLPDLLAKAPHGAGFELTVSNFDHRVMVCIDDKELMPPLDVPYPEPPPDDGLQSAAPAEMAAQLALIQAQQNRFGLGVEGGILRLERIRIYRDVHYAAGRAVNAVKRPFHVPADAYFVLGDNSPLSSDSRNWKKPAVPGRLLIGKPFIVHLPSRPGKLTIGGLELPIRIPDFQRIRYIH